MRRAILIQSSEFHLAWTAWGLTMAAYSHNLQLQSYIRWLLMFLAWSFSARSLGCTINDMCDYKYDREVGKSRFLDHCLLRVIKLLSERTRTRPIASGRISLLSAGLFSAAQLFIYLALMWTDDHVQ